MCGCTYTTCVGEDEVGSNCRSTRRGGGRGETLGRQATVGGGVFHRCHETPGDCARLRRSAGLVLVSTNLRDMNIHVDIEQTQVVILCGDNQNLGRRLSSAVEFVETTRGLQDERVVMSVWVVTGEVDMVDMMRSADMLGNVPSADSLVLH